jgi:glycogen debranching enzyme
MLNPTDEPALLSGAELRQSAEAVLSGNWAHDHTVPSRALYPHQWSWDSAFTAIGLAHCAPDRAWTELRTLFAAQWPDGRVPHIVFNPSVAADRYFPGASFWNSSAVLGPQARPTSGIVQPPLHALAASLLYRAAPTESARQELTALYPRLVAQQDYLARHRDVGGGGLACIVHPWESGLDNSPAWDGALAALNGDSTTTREHCRQDIRFADANHRPTDTDYARYILLAQTYRAGGYADDGLAAGHQFLVECPLFNSITALAEHALTDIATVVGADASRHRTRAAALTQALVDRLFDNTTGTFHARDLRTGQLLRVHTVANLAPLILPLLPRRHVASILAEAASPRFGLRMDMALPPVSYDRTAPDFDHRRYWRGPVWMNTSWLLWYGLRSHREQRLADALRTCALNMVERSGFHEYYDPTTAEGIGAPTFSWTAALTLDLLAAGPQVDVEPQAQPQVDAVAAA